jgi:hypothetical protein
MALSDMHSTGLSMRSGDDCLARRTIPDVGARRRLSESHGAGAHPPTDSADQVPRAEWSSFGLPHENNADCIPIHASGRHSTRSVLAESYTPAAKIVSCADGTGGLQSLGMATSMPRDRCERSARRRGVPLSAFSIGEWTKALHDACSDFTTARSKRSC